MTVTGLKENQAYGVRWFNTWDGGDVRTAATFSTGQGQTSVDIPIHEFAQTSFEPGNAWDGADVLLIIMEQ